MSTPAERYAAAAARGRRARSELGRFAESLGFPLDDFQVQACEAVEAGRGVLVAAPTGAGKTVVGEFAVHLALASGRKAFYTTPIKALSNQKYHDLVRQHGADRVGLLTGDASVNGDAPVVVMTTEVLRNMMYAGSSTLQGLGFVVMDEVHYLADRFRGAVWEEVIIHLPEDVQVISLSATVSNAEEFGDWLAEVRGNHSVIVSEHRPVPLWQHMLVGTTMFDLFADDADPAAGSGGPGRPARLNPHLVEAIRNAEQRGRWDTDPRPTPGTRGGRAGHRGRVPRGPGGGPGGRGFARGGRPGGGATRAEVVEQLEREGLLPAITFVFSRVGCDAAVGQLLAAGTTLIPEQEGDRIRRLVEDRVDVLADEDLSVLGYWDFLDGLTRGFAAHHAGMLPLFREIVEELFTAGPDQGGLRHRDPRPRHQHARPHRRPREAREVQRRDPCRHHPGRVHPAHRTRRAPGHRHRGARPGAVDPRPGPPRGRWPRLDPDLPAALELPAHLQHGRQPRGPGGPGRRTGDPRDLVRPVPGRPGRRRAGRRRCAATRRRWAATPRRCTATSATSGSMPRYGGRSPTSRRRAPRSGQRAVGRRRRSAWSR